MVPIAGETTLVQHEPTGKMLRAPKHRTIKVARNCYIILLSLLSQKEDQLNFTNLRSRGLTPHSPLRACIKPQLVYYGHDSAG